jgi:hypothetical protein
VFENRVLRRVFRLKREEVTDGWRKLHDEELPNLYSLSSIISRMRWVRHIPMACMGEMKNKSFGRKTFSEETT